MFSYSPVNYSIDLVLPSLRGRKVTSLGVLFDFTGGAKGTSVQQVADMVNEKWFSEAIKEEPDLFLLAGHMPIMKEDPLDKWPLVFNAIRALHPCTPILILGAQYDGRSMALQSGRYMETIGKNTFTFAGCAKVKVQYHTGIKDADFDTTLGTFITRGLKALAEKFGLNLVYGNAPRDYTMNQSPYPSDSSLLSLFAEKALPYALSVNNTRNKIPNLIIVNAFSQRFDLYSGPFTKDDQMTVSFYPDRFLYISNVSLSDAKKALSALNGSRPLIRRDFDFESREHGSKEDDLQYVDEKYNAWLRDMSSHTNVEGRATRSQTPGYVTKDSCPGIGDDTLHTPLVYYDIPRYLHSEYPDVPETAPIDLVFIDYIEPRVLTFLNDVQTVKLYRSSDVEIYSHVLANEALGIYAQAHWN
ncbi:hypothetical protein C0992_009785 [Termitomyces sp. T32_za158]|nr:hypothetical protein C0992_009785 [Termitomyces sp. T32_za158]